MNTLTFIDALPEHEPLIRALSDATFATHAARVPHAFHDGNAYQHMLLNVAFATQPFEQADFRCKLVVAQDDSTPVGYILIIWRQPAVSDEVPATIADIGVFPEFTGRGVGTALLDHARSLMQAERWHSLSADVWYENVASHKMFVAADFTPERTEYRFGQPPIPSSDDKDPAATPSISRSTLLILLALTAGLLIYLNA